MASSVFQSEETRKAELVLAQLDAIPPLSPVATRIITLTDDRRSNADQLVKLIETDPPLTARLLSILSRAEHGVRADGVNLKNAVVMLGFAAVRQVTLSLKIMEVFENPVARPAESEFDRAEFWKHCLAVACAARRISEITGNSAGPEEAFVAGLLHDLGKIALQTALPKSFERIVRRANAERCDIADVEREFLGVDHTIVGHRLAERWRLPARLCECIWLHHHPFEALPASIAAHRQVQIVQLADLMAREQRIGYSGNYSFQHSSREIAAQLGLSEADHLRIVESLGEEIEQRAAWIGDDQINTRQVYLKALLQTSEELTAANAELLKHNERLKRKSEFFSALRELNSRIAPKAGLREVCAAGAASLRTALATEAMLVFVVHDDSRFLEFGLANPAPTSGVFTLPLEPCEILAEGQAAAEFACAGTWIAPPPGGFRPILDRFRGKLGDGTPWLLPLVREQRFVGGAVFAFPTNAARDLKSNTDELEGISVAVGLAITQAADQAAASALSNELAEVNRRLVAARQKALQAKTLETIVAMAAGAAHELNNPLAVISGHAQILRDSSSAQDVRECADAICKHAQICSDIVTELMDFARPAPPKPESIALSDLLHSIQEELMTAGLLEKDRCSIVVPSDTPNVWFDRGRLARLLGELLKNAIEASTPDSRPIGVKAQADPTEETVSVVIVDNGRGMAADLVSRAMDPFVSQRAAGRGRGLGLSRVQRWLQQGGGHIEIKSEPGRGTIVEVRLPAAP